MKRKIILIQSNCGKYDLFIKDLPLGLLYSSRLIAEHYDVRIIDQRIEGDKFYDTLKLLLDQDPLWVGLTAMTGEPVYHSLNICRFLRKYTKAPLVWGGIHPTILSESTIKHELVDFVVRGKAERSVQMLSQALEGKGSFSDVRGLTYVDKGGEVVDVEEDSDSEWSEMPMVPYHLVNIDDYARQGFEQRVFPIMTSRNCPHKCTFCYNSSLPGRFRWYPDDMDYARKHIDFIIENYNPSYMSFIDDDFFVDRDRAREILKYYEKVKPPKMKTGFRGVRISDLRCLGDDDFELLKRINTIHINIGVESGSDRILKHMRKGMRAKDAIDINRRFDRYPQFIPLYNFFSGIPTETKDDIRLSTRLILRLTKENRNSQISGFHQYTPYPGNKLFQEAVDAGFPVPETLDGWGDSRFEDNAANCPWIDNKRKKLLDMIYCMVYFVDNKYDTYFAKTRLRFRLLQPLVALYKPVARLRLRYHITILPLEIIVKDLIYRIFYTPTGDISETSRSKFNKDHSLRVAEDGIG